MKMFSSLDISIFDRYAIFQKLDVNVLNFISIIYSIPPIYGLKTLQCASHINLHTHSSFESIHLTGQCLNLASIVISLLLSHPQSIIIPGCSFGEVSKLAFTVTNKERGRENLELDCSINDESEVRGE